MAGEYALLVRFRLHEDAGAGFDALVGETIEQIRACEPDTLAYTSHLLHDRPHERIFYELYRNEEAFLIHGQQPHVQRFLRQREQYVESFEVDVLEPTARR